MGSTVAEVQSAYGADAEIVFEDVFEFWVLTIEFEAGAIYGSVSGDQPADVVQFLEAGGLCGE